MRCEHAVWYTKDTTEEHVKIIAGHDKSCRRPVVVLAVAFLLTQNCEVLPCCLLLSDKHSCFGTRIEWYLITACESQMDVEKLYSLSGAQKTGTFAHSFGSSEQLQEWEGGRETCCARYVRASEDEGSRALFLPFHGTVRLRVIMPPADCVDMSGVAHMQQ